MVTTQNTDRCWYALYTRPRFEKKVDTALRQENLHSFLPLRTVLRHWSNNRRKKIEEPLFPSYVFVHADSAERYMAAHAYGVARMVRFGLEPARIPEQQIHAIYRLLGHGCDPEPHQFFNQGDEVEVVSGPLVGLRGFFFEERGKNKLVISVDAIQQSIAVEVRKGQVKRIKSAEHRLEKRPKSNIYINH